MKIQEKILFLIIIITLITLTYTIEQNQQSLNQVVLGKTYEGSWSMPDQQKIQVYKIPFQGLINDWKIDNQTLFNKTQISQGQMLCYFYYRYHQEQQQKNFLYDYATDLYIQLYSPKYRDQKLLVLDFQISNIWKAQKNYWKGQVNGLATIYTQYNKQVVFQTAGKLTAQINQIVNSLKDQNQPRNITLVFKGGSVQFKAQLKHAEYSYNHIVGYIFLIFVQLIMLISYFPSRNHITKSLQLRTSEWLILHSVSYYFFTAVAGVMLIGLPKIDTELKWYFFIGFLNCGLALYMARKFQPVFEKFKQNKMMLMGVIFFFTYQIVSFKLFYIRSYWVVESMLFLWQIAYSIKRGGRGGFPIILLFIIITSRIPLYYRFLFQNQIFRQKSQPYTAIIIIASQAFHILIIFCQAGLGGRFFVINELVPDYYNYYFKKKSNHEALKQQCSICLVQIRKNPDEQEGSQMKEKANASDHDLGIQPLQSSTHSETNQQASNINNQSETNDNLQITDIRFMLTPCKHIFHVPCLTDWMQNRLICPFCRRELPPLSQL